MRSEEFGRFLRRARLSAAAFKANGGPGLPGFDAKRLWGCVFRRAVHAENAATSAFWTAQVKDEALLHQCRLWGEAELTNDGTVASYSKAKETQSSSSNPTKGRKRARDPTPSGHKGARRRKAKRGRRYRRQEW